MSNLKYFFRAIEDGRPFDFLGIPHILIILFGIAGGLLIYRHRNRLTNSKLGPVLIKVLASTLLLTQIIRYAWNLGSGHFSLEEGLPLYPCRIAVWLLIASGLFRLDRLWPLGFAWGGLGALIATVLADTYKFTWPHFTNIEFFVTHIGMGWLILTQIIVNKPVFTNKTLNSLIAQTNLFLLVSWLTNLTLRQLGYAANYAYLVKAPDFLQGIIPPGLPFSIFIVFAYNLAVYLIYLSAQAAFNKIYALQRSRKNELHKTTV